MLFPMPLLAGQKTDDLRVEIAVLTEELQNVQARETGLAEKRRNLAAAIQKIKTTDSGGFFPNLRLQWKLRELRDLLNEEVDLEKRENDHLNLLTEKKDDLREEIRGEVREKLDLADAAHRQKRPEETWERYLEIHTLLREYESLAGSEGKSDPESAPPGGGAGSEPQVRLREISKILALHADHLNREIQNLEEEQKTLSRELSLKKGLSRFQGILERSAASTPSEEIPAENKIRIREGEQRVKDLERRIRDTRELRKALMERGRNLGIEAGRIDKGGRGKKR
ncbi:MAG: hypothetical protein HY760_08795 [Nitrospirae bacterium]|nr:hypothetical protein [Nitrospirota bacterium]